MMLKLYHDPTSIRLSPLPNPVFSPFLSQGLILNKLLLPKLCLHTRFQKPSLLEGRGNSSSH